MKKLIIATTLALLSGSTFAATWHDSSPQELEVQFSLPGVLTLTPIAHQLGTKLNTDAVLAEMKADSSVAQVIGFQWKDPIPGKAVQTVFKDAEGNNTIEAQMEDVSNVLLVPSKDDSNWFVTTTAVATDTSTTIHIAPVHEGQVQPGEYSAQMQVAQYAP
ncbi:hypothetical protein [Serratia sp. 2723]|uniref:hypothetical protein n=1 Tax=unclassified Serratia (in: enterobacteria) TaxID=2647522 RepID=UPI003D1D547C